MRIFYTFVLPDRLVAKYNLSFAGANFSRNLINSGGFDKVYSVMPTNIYGKIEKIENINYDIVYSKLREKGRIIAKFATFFEQYHVFKKVKKGDSIWFYNITMVNFLLFILLSVFKSTVKLNVIVLDFTPPNKWYDKNHFFLKLINKADGIISLSNSDLFKVNNKLLLAGVVPKENIEYPKISNIEKSFLLSGVINNAIASIREVLNAFSQLPECTLHITGRVLEDYELIKEYTFKYKNIIYHGSVNYQEYINILHNVTFIISSRNPDYPENNCNFPSKIIESILHNRIIISTIKYPQLEDINYFTISKKEMASDIHKIVSKSDKELIKYANESDKVKKMFSTQVWLESINKIENTKEQ